MSLNQEDSLHYYLKEAIKSAHNKLDKNPILVALLSDNVSIDQYANALAALHGIYFALEKNIMSYLATKPDLFDYHARLKTPILEENLRLLGKMPFISKIEFPYPNNDSELIGMLYVIEGSMMGGQFLARKLGDKFPVHFFNGYGENTAQKWQEFWLFANVVCANNQYEEVLKMAISLFESIELHLKNSTV